MQQADQIPAHRSRRSFGDPGTGAPAGTRRVKEWHIELNCMDQFVSDDVAPGFPQFTAAEYVPDIEKDHGIGKAKAAGGMESTADVEAIDDESAVHTSGTPWRPQTWRWKAPGFEQFCRIVEQALDLKRVASGNSVSSSASSIPQLASTCSRGPPTPQFTRWFLSLTTSTSKSVVGQPSAQREADVESRTTPSSILKRSIPTASTSCFAFRFLVHDGPGR